MRTVSTGKSNRKIGSADSLLEITHGIQMSHKFHRTLFAEFNSYLKVFDLIPLKKEIKAEVSGLYIVGVKGIRGSLQTPAPKKKGFFAKFKKDKTAR